MYMLEKELITCMGHQTVPMIISVVGNIMHVGICYFLSYHTPLGIKGISVGNAISNFNLFIILHLYIRFFIKD